MCKQPYSATTMDLVFYLRAVTGVAPSMSDPGYNLSKQKTRSRIGKNISERSAVERRGGCSAALGAQETRLYRRGIQMQTLPSFRLPSSLWLASPEPLSFLPVLASCR
jgi:hypothetical protein